MADIHGGPILTTGTNWDDPSYDRYVGVAAGLVQLLGWLESIKGSIGHATGIFTTTCSWKHDPYINVAGFKVDFLLLKGNLFFVKWEAGLPFATCFLKEKSTPREEDMALGGH